MEALVQSFEKEINSLMKTGKAARLTMTVDPRRMAKFPKIERTPVEERTGRTAESTGELRLESVAAKDLILWKTLCYGEVQVI